VGRISPALVSRSHSLADPRWSPSGTHLAWVDSFDGRGDLVVAPVDGSEPPRPVTADVGVGGGYCWASDDELVVAGRDGKLALVAATGGVVRTLTQEGRAFSPALSVRGEIACGIERADACDIVTVPIDGSQWPVRVSHADYAWDPAWSTDGRELAWHEWTLPDMPWDASRIVVRDENGKTRVVAEAPACGQPRFAPDGRLAYIREGQLWIDDARLIDEAYEHAETSWGPGQHSFVWSPDGEELAWCRNEDGFGRLVIGSPGKKFARELSKGWHRGLAWDRNGIVCVRSGAVTTPHVAVLAPNGSARRHIAYGPPAGFKKSDLVEPKAITWKSGGATIPGLLWRPHEPRGARPPLLVSVHGGPTSQALADWAPRLQYFSSRGWAVLQPNYRGSTGYGDVHRRALEGHWGVRDVDDVAAGIKHVTKEGFADARCVVLMGGSAGGLTVLNLAALNPDLVTAVIALFPVTDLIELDATTHRFESGYNARLVGPLPDARDTYVANSATTHADKIRVPVLLLHGSGSARAVGSDRNRAAPRRYAGRTARLRR
jgi:dipeptidyl aminopeptidase/acylaminoacyl peptidase